MTIPEMFYQIDVEILAMIAKRLGRGSVASAEWQMSKLMEQATVSRDAMRIVEKYRDAILTGTTQEIQAASDEAVKQIDNYLEPLARPVPKISPQLQLTVETWAKTATNQANLAMSTLTQAAGQVYTDIVNKSVLTVLEGSLTKQEAMVSAIRGWAEIGLPAFRDKSNRLWSAEATGSMIIRTNQRRVATQTMFDRADDYGTDLIEVSSHSGARPGCFPYQGRIYSKSGTSQNYPAFSSTTYGQPAGILGIQCRHVVYPFFPGLSEKRNKPTENKAENAESYQESQQQRYLERRIRNAKREQAAMEGLGDENAIRDAKQKVRSAQADMRAFIEDTGRTRRSPREQIYSK